MGQKNIFLRVLGSKLKKQCKKEGFPNILNLQKIWNLFYSELSDHKNDVKIEVRKSQKTHSDSKTDSNVRFKVQNAGPYTFVNETDCAKLSISAYLRFAPMD